MSSGNKPLPEPVLTKISNTIWHHQAPMSKKNTVFHDCNGIASILYPSWQCYNSIISYWTKSPWGLRWLCQRHDDARIGNCGTCTDSVYSNTSTFQAWNLNSQQWFWLISMGNWISPRHKILRELSFSLMEILRIGRWDKKCRAVSWMSYIWP